MSLKSRGIVTEPVLGLSREAVYALDQAAVQNFLKEESESRERTPVPAAPRQQIPQTHNKKQQM